MSMHETDARMPKNSTPFLAAGEPIERRGSLGYLLGGFRFDPSVPCLYHVDKAGKAPGVLVDPQPSDRAFRLLLLLVERNGQVASREEIFKWVWGVGPRDLDPSNIHVLVCELRKALGRASIETLARRGYRIALEIIVIERPQRVSAEDERAITTVYGLSPERLQELIKAAVSDAFAAHNDGMGDLSYWLELPSL
jgi:DNA-binding winged helix-turn-helix (wHTH) protein